MKLLEKFEIYGISDTIEDIILASLLLGDPCLLIGRHGTAKTEIIKLIGQALQQSAKRKGTSFNFQIYDASKLNPEDLVGFPNIDSLTKHNKVEFIASPISIWGKELVGFDEINRTSEEVQNNLFELIRSRKCNGIPTGTKFIYGTMNPFGDTGTASMSNALVDRFTFFLHFNDFSSMEDSDRVNIIKRVGDVDALGLRYWKHISEKFDVSEDSINEVLADIGDTIQDLMDTASKEYFNLQKKYQEGMPTFLATFSKSVIEKLKSNSIKEQNEVDISGRRASMIYRALLAIYSIKKAKNTLSELYSLPSFKETVFQTLKYTYPVGIANKLDSNFYDKVQIAIAESIDGSWKTLESNVSTETVKDDFINDFMNTKDIVKQLIMILELDKDSLISADLWTSIVDNAVTTNNKAYLKTIVTFLNNTKLYSIPEQILANWVAPINDLDVNIKYNPTMNLFSELIDLYFAKVKNDPVLTYILTESIMYYNKFTEPEIVITCIKNINKLLTFFKEKQKIKPLSDEELLSFGIL